MNSKDEVTLIEVLSIKDLINKILSRKYFLIIFTAIFAFLSFFSSFLLDTKYTSSAILKSSSEGVSDISSTLSQYSGLANLAGININGSGTDSTAYALEVIKSKSFVKDLITKDNVLPMLMAVDYYDHSKGKVVYDKNIYDEESNQWVRKPKKGRNQKPDYLETYNSVVKNDLRVSLDKTTNFFKVSFTHESPKFANDFVYLVIETLNDIERNKEIKEAEQSLAFLSIQYEENLNASVQKSINNLYEIQLEREMLANVKKDYLISVIDYPFVPNKKSFPQRLLFLLIGLIFGALISTSIILFWKNK